MTSFSGRRRALALLVAGLLVVCGVVPVASAAPTDARGAADGADASLSATLAQADEEPNATETDSANDSTERPPHRNPDEVSENGDLGALESSLARELQRRLGDSAIQISEGQYEAGRELLGDDYDGTLSRYVTVDGETGDGASGAGETYEETAAQQREFADAAREYERTRAEYEEAKNAGDTARARELARELQTIADEVDQNGQELTESYEQIGEQSGTDVSEPVGAIDETRTRIVDEQDEIREAEFIETELSVSTDATVVSFADPATLVGTVTTADGEPVANEEIRIKAGNRTMATTTDADGSFEVSYRPTRLPVNATNVSVAFVPPADSIYFGSSEAVSLTVEATDSAVTLENVSESAAAGESVAVDGRVTAADSPVGGVPVALTVEGVAVARTVTDDDGSFAFDAPLPAAVRDGDRELRVRVAQQDRAVATSDARATISVAETATALTLSATREANASTAVVAGELTAASGTPLADQQIRILVDGTVVETVRTDGAGRYETRVSIDGLEAGETVRIVAHFDGRATSYAESRAAATVGGAGGGEAGGLAAMLPALTSPAVWGGLALLGFLVGLWFWLRDEEDLSELDDERSQPPDAGAPAPEPTGEAVLERARDRLAAGETNAAVIAAYGAVRRRLEGRVDPPPGATHWEFLAACRDAAVVESGLESLTRAFERATFDAADVDAEEAAAALAAAERVGG